MEIIKKKYIVDEDQNKIAVQITISDFEKIEQTLEDFALIKIIEENDHSENLTVQEAKNFYRNLDKSE